MAFEFLKYLFTKKDNTTDTLTQQRVTVSDFLDTEQESAVLGLEMYLQRLAFWSCVRKIGAAVAAVEWETYRRERKVKASEYWAWNHDPNPNQTKYEFFETLISQLYLKQEAIVVETREGHRYVAEAYSVERHLSGDIYSDIFSCGENIPGVYRSSDILHFTITGNSIQQLLIGIASAEGKLMKTAAKKYIRSGGTRGILNIDADAEADDEFESTYEDLVNNKFKKYFSAENAVLPLYAGYKYDQEQKSIGANASTSGTRDMRAMMDDIVEMTAKAFGVPISIVTGDKVSAEDFKSFLTYPIQPLALMIAQEINRKIYGQRLVYSGTYVTANLGSVKYTDLFDVANPIDKLISSGAFCINDIRLRLGMDVINEPWAEQHWMTKNYATVEDLLDGVDEEQKVAPVQPEEDRKKEEDKEQDGTESENDPEE
ncbi:MAG: phage portal protein [Lachnospiraceae bacterium]|nr:phage portal protein [Lachnospiraceae bacterium]MBR1852677.1 phage portal protein [Lachnospiraceae bacterium]